MQTDLPWRGALTNRICCIGSCWATRVAPLAAALAFGSADPANAANAISRAIERAQPCGSLKTQQLGQTIGIDKFKSAELKTLNVDINGDNAKIAFVGSLACMTSDQALIKGDAFVEFSGAAELDLATCAVKQISVHVLSVGGTFGPIADAFKDKIQISVGSSISEQVKVMC